MSAQTFLPPIKVFVASPSDVERERGIVREVIDELNKVWFRAGISMVMLDWRDQVTPYLGQPPEPTILKQLPIDTWDVLVCILWGRMGTPTGNVNPETGQPFQSGTEEEFTLAYQLNQKLHYPKILLYRCMRPIPVRNLEGEREQYDRVSKFFMQFKRGGGYFGLTSEFKSRAEFRTMVLRHLSDVLLDWQASKLPKPSVPEVKEGNIDKWLRKFELGGHPFYHSAAGEDPGLPKYFYQFVPYYDELLGRSREYPTSITVFGDRGTGKTALSQMVQHECLLRPGPGGRNVLAIPYTQFDLLIEKLEAGEKISPRDHVRQIIQAGLKTLAGQPASLELRPNVSEAQKALFQTYLKEFGKGLRIQLLSAGIEDTSASLPESYIDLLHEFCRSIRIFGYDMVYILVDQVDESYTASEEANKIADFLAPLMSDLRLLDAPDHLLTFRFFLPTALETPLRDRGVRIGERIAVRRVTWMPAELHMLIAKRLEYFSPPSHKYSEFAELSSVPNLDKQLVKLAEGNPRTLIRLCGQMIAEHCKWEFDDNNLLLTKEDLDQAIRELGLGQTELAPAAAEASSSPQSKSGTAIPSDPISWLPTPLAMLVAQYQNEQNSQPKMWSAFYLLETMLRLVGCSLLALYNQNGAPNTSLDDTLARLLFSTSMPPTMGAWREATDRLLKVPVDHPIFSILSRFRASKELGRSMHQLIDIRNAVAHRPVGPESTYVNDVSGHIQGVIKELEELSSLELLAAEDVYIDDSGNIIHNCSIYEGNVLVPGKGQFTFAKNYQRNHLILYDAGMASSIDLWPYGMMSSALPEGKRLERTDIMLFDRLSCSQNSGQTSANFTGILNQSEISSATIAENLKPKQK